MSLVLFSLISFPFLVIDVCKFDNLSFILTLLGTIINLKTSSVNNFVFVCNVGGKRTD